MPVKTYDTAYRKNEEPPPPNDPKGYRGAAPKTIIPQQPALLIAGDTQWPQAAGPHVHRYIDQVVARAKSQDMRLILPDNDKGVGASALLAARNHEVDATVYGISRQARNPHIKATEQARYLQVMNEEVKPGTEQQRIPRPGTHGERNQAMLAGAERVMVIWNGQSKGTRAFYQQAVAAGKAADLVVQREGRMQVAESFRPTPEIEEDTEPPPPAPPEEGVAATQDEPQAVYTLGYAGVEIEEVQAAAQQLDATLVDIRLAGRSRKRGFNKSALQQTFGEDYLHLPQLGNANYNQRDKGIQLRDYEAGLAQLREAAPDKPLLLMCGCKSVHTCHRKEVAERLATDGYAYQGEALSVLQEREQASADMAGEGDTSPPTPDIDEEAARQVATEAPTRADVPDDDLEPDDAAMPAIAYGAGADLAHMDLEGQFDLSCELSAATPELLAEELAEGLRFKALPVDVLADVGVKPLTPSLDEPPYYDAQQDVALWVGVVREDEQRGTTCLLAVEDAQSTTPQAYLTPCYHGDLSTAQHNGQELIEALQNSQDVGRLLGVAEGMARSNGLHHLWSRPDGLPLEDSVSDALAQHLHNEQESELNL